MGTADEKSHVDSRLVARTSRRSLLRLLLGSPLLLPLQVLTFERLLAALTDREASAEDAHELRRELEIVMKQMGTPTVESITPAHVRPAACVGAH